MTPLLATLAALALLTCLVNTAARRGAASPANRELLRLIDHLRQAEDLMADYRATHRDGCRCGFCRGNAVAAGGIAEALAAMPWVLMMCRRQLEGVAYPK